MSGKKRKPGKKYVKFCMRHGGYFGRICMACEIEKQFHAKQQTERKPVDENGMCPDCPHEPNYGIKQ